MAEASPDCAVTLTPRPKEKGKMKAKVVPSPAPPPTVPPTAQPPTASAQAPKAPKATQKAHASHTPPPSPSYAKAAAPGPTWPKLVTRPSLMISLCNPQHHSTLQSLAMLQAPCLVEISNEALGSKACYTSVRLSAAKWSPLGNLVVFMGPDTTLTQLQSAHHLITSALKGALPGAASHLSCPNVKWSKILIRSVPTGVTDCMSQAHSCEECHQALLHDNPSYHCLRMTQLPSWVRKPSLYKAFSASSLVVSFEDPDGTVLSSLLAARHLFGFGAQLTVCKWCQPPPLTNKNIAAAKQRQRGLVHMAKVAAPSQTVVGPLLSKEIRPDGTFTQTYANTGPPPPATTSAAPPPPPSVATMGPTAPVLGSAPSLASLIVLSPPQVRCKKRKTGRAA